MNQTGYAFLGLTAMVGALVAVIVFAFLRFASAARDTRQHARAAGGGETTFLAAALQEAVAKLKAQEQEMRARAAASEERSAQIVESVTAGLLLVDSTGRVEMLNPAGRRLLDVKHDPMGTDYRDVLAAAAPLAEAIGECLATGRSIGRRVLRMPESLPALHLGITVSPVGAEAPSDGSQGAICLFSDLTAVVELEDQLRLRDALAQVGEMTAGIAHEFRNGLATIHGYARLLDPQALPDKYRPYVEGIRQETDLLGHMVTNFLGFARPEQTQFVPVALDAAARRAAADLRHELPADARVDVTGTWTPIDGDEGLLRQVFGNLIRNAVEACQDTGRSPAVAIRGEVDAAQGVCRVSVDDNGPGVPEASRARVFQPFVTTRSRGTGLGLAIVQKIVVLHDGRVAIRATPEGGASVQLTFQLTTPA